MTLEEFLQAPASTITSFAPPTLFWIVEGTRRSAALAGIPTMSEEYPRWSFLRMFECVDVMFRHGVKHIFTPLLSPSHFAESSPRYRERLVDWVALVLSDGEIRQILERSRWRIRLIGDASVPGLAEIAQQLVDAFSPPNHEHTLWMSVISEPGAMWSETLAAALRSGARSQAELVRALYGDDIPLATMLLGFGKPVFSTNQIPPALIGKVECYWTQRPGYRLTEPEFRKILYDATFVRRTWVQDKSGRAEQAVEHRAAWEQGTTLGLGTRLGPHWYPAPFDIPEE